MRNPFTRAPGRRGNDLFFNPFGGGRLGVVTAPVDRWNDADKSVLITVSEDGFTAIANGNGEGQVRSVIAHMTGRKWFRIVITAHATPILDNLAFGLASASHPYTNYLGKDTTSAGPWPKDSGTKVYLNDVATDYGTEQYAIPGSYYDVLVDFDIDRLWFKHSLNLATGFMGKPIEEQDPLNNIGGHDISGLTGAPWHVCADIEVAGDALTLITGASPYVGFDNWGEV
jgi:hypothetical protein